jgi:flagellar biosynthesis protein FlhB
MVGAFESISRFDTLPGNLPRLGMQGYVFLLKLLVPFLVLLGLLGVLASLIQVGPLWAKNALKFDPARPFNPKNFARFFSKETLVNIPSSIGNPLADKNRRGQLPFPPGRSMIA